MPFIYPEGSMSIRGLMNISALQPAHFGRVYAAYGSVFVVLSLLWGWWLDGHRPDTPDVAGALLCLAGVAVIMYWPRAAGA